METEKRTMAVDAAVAAKEVRNHGMSAVYPAADMITVPRQERLTYCGTAQS